MGPPWIGLVSPAHPSDALIRCLIQVRYGDHINTLNTLLKLFLNIFCGAAGRIVLLTETTAIRKCHEVVYLVCNYVQVGDMCQSNSHIKTRTKVFLAKHAQSNHTAFTCLPFSHTASWCCKETSLYLAVLLM